MTMNHDQTRLLFDRVVGIASQQEIHQTEKLIRSNADAARVFSKLQEALAPLKAIQDDPCPKHLVKATYERLGHAKKQDQEETR